MGQAMGTVIFIIVMIVVSLAKSKGKTPPKNRQQGQAGQNLNTAMQRAAAVKAASLKAARQTAGAAKERPARAQEPAIQPTVAPTAAAPQETVSVTAHVPEHAHLPHDESAPFDEGGEGTEGPGYHPCVSHEDEKAAAAPMPRLTAEQMRRAVITKEILDRPVSVRQRRFAR